MKLVDVSEFFAEQGGGVKTYVHQKLAAGARLGHEVVVVAPGPYDREEPRHGGKIVWVKSPPLPVDPRYHVFTRPSRVHAVLDAEGPDVVEGSSPWMGGWSVARWKGRAKKALVYHQDPVAVLLESMLSPPLAPKHVDRVGLGFWRYLSRLSSHFDTTITSGAWLAKRLRHQGLERAVAVPFGVDSIRFHPSKRDEELRARLLARAGAPSDARLMITVSRHHPEKRLGTVLRAFAHVRRKHAAGLVLFGDGPFRRWVERQARAIPGVVVAGSVGPDALATALASADLLLHGSAAETYGLAVAEAICARVPVVVPDRGGALDLVDPSHAEIYRTGDAMSAAEAIERMLARLPIGPQAARTAQRKIGTMDDHFNALFSLYHDLSVKMGHTCAPDARAAPSQIVEKRGIGQNC